MAAMRVVDRRGVEHKVQAQTGFRVREMFRAALDGLRLAIAPEV
jgi:hypothetical protein